MSSVGIGLIGSSKDEVNFSGVLAGRDARSFSWPNHRFVIECFGAQIPTYGPYITSKAGVEGLVRVLANELRGRDITVNGVAPGPVATELFLQGKTKAQIAELSKVAPLERLGNPADIARVVSFLAGEDGGWLTPKYFALTTSSKEKLDLVKNLGADFAINYTEQDWVARVEHATGGRGVDVVLEANSGEIGDKSFKLMAPFGRAVVYGAKNAHDSFPTARWH